MKRSTALAISFALIGVAIVYSAIVYSSLPNPAPSHWNAEGKIDGYANPAFICFLTPGIMVLIVGMLMALPKMSPEKFKVDSWERVYNLIMVLVAAMTASIHFVILNATKDNAMLLPKFLFAVMFVFFALMGNFIGKVRRNFWVGVRTPWTLSSDTVWNIVHRRAGQLWVATGIVGTILVLCGMSFWFSFGLLMSAALFPVIHSYFVWKRVEGGGQKPTAA